MTIPPSIENKLKAAEDAQSGSRIVIGTMNVACWIGIVLLWNGYFSWTYHSEIDYIQKTTFDEKSFQREVANEKIKQWTKSRSSSLSLLGTSLDVDDIVPVCGIGFLAISFWLNFCFLRELAIVKSILIDADSLCVSNPETKALKKYIYDGLISYSLFSGQTLPRNRPSYLLFCGLMFLPVLVSAVCFIFDVRSLFFPHYLRKDSQTLIESIRLQNMMSFLYFWYFSCFVINILLVLSCRKAFVTSGSIDIMLTQFAVKNKLDAEAAAFHDSSEHIENYIVGWRRLFLALVAFALGLLVFCIYLHDYHHPRVCDRETARSVALFFMTAFLFTGSITLAFAIDNASRTRLFYEWTSGFFRSN